MTLKEKHLRLLDRMFDNFTDPEFRKAIFPLIIGCMDEQDQYEHNQFMQMPAAEKKEILQYELKLIEDDATNEVKILGRHLKMKHADLFKRESEQFVLTNKDLTIYDWLTFLWKTYEKNGLYEELIDIICKEM